MNAPPQPTPDILPLFEQMTQLHVAVIGDFALDLYFDYDTDTNEVSVETGLPVYAGSRARASLGAAGNVVQNLLALGVGQVWAVGCVGPDLFGREMRHLFERQNVPTDYLLTVEAGWDTCVYAKPMRGATEANRIDFGGRNTLSDDCFAQLMSSLNALLPQLDVLIINQQFRCPLLTPDRIGPLNDLIEQHPSVCYVADLRDSGMLLRNVTLKVNTAELARFRHVAHPSRPDLNWCVEHGRALAQQISGSVVVTRGEAGICYVDQQAHYVVNGLALPGPLDTVGAGDTVVAALAATLPTSVGPVQALTIANAAAAVTVQKLGQTGTATPEEVYTVLR